MNVKPRDEPVRLSALINTAIISTINVFALVFGWSETVVASLNLAVGAWVLVGGELVRMRTEPFTPKPLTDEPTPAD